MYLEEAQLDIEIMYEEGPVSYDVPTLNAAARKLYDLNYMEVLRTFHRDGCTGLVVDQYGNEPFNEPA